MNTLHILKHYLCYETLTLISLITLNGDTTMKYIVTLLFIALLHLNINAEDKDFRKWDKSNFNWQQATTTKLGMIGKYPGTKGITVKSGMYKHKYSNNAAVSLFWTSSDGQKCAQRIFEGRVIHSAPEIKVSGDTLAVEVYYFPSQMGAEDPMDLIAAYILDKKTNRFKRIKYPPYNGFKGVDIPLKDK